MNFAARGTVERVFGKLSATDAILLQIHITKGIPWTAGNRMKIPAGDLRETRSAVYLTTDESKGDAVSAVETAMRAQNVVTSKAADQAAAALRAAFEEAKPGLLVRHDKLVAHVNTCLTALKFEEATAKGRPRAS
ncbi:MAG: hypothetical protein KKH74_01470 [Gammaproteobacteria bacterium]|nr:hypothetical protein [Gammaproteobacteria bacterium]MBU1732493.1 hypothetical protein [Gammaproteobacteria bacterium]MBU1892629.1 hypothetical protein [Gammaproteobacteria bacterium]